MKKEALFEPYHKLGFTHFVNKNLLGLKRPKADTRRFYFSLLFLILAIGILM
ncbi:MAG: hypothetical protein R3224_05325 [Balneolaceae bacterium]|nr:hypothetical protein [Balneolaceae bacterium]